MADQRTMVELLRDPTEGYAEAIVVPPILAEQFELKHNLINMMTSDQFFGLEKDNPHDHIRWGSPSVAQKRTPAFYSHLEWDRYKDLLRACHHHGFTELHQLDTFYNALNPTDQDSLNSAAGGNLLERRTQDVLMITKNKSKVRNYRNKSIVSQVKSSDAKSSSSFEIAKLTHAVNQQTSTVTTAMTAILKQFQATPPQAFVKAIEEICVTCGGAHPYYHELEKIKRMNKANMKAMQNQINNMKNELRNEMKNSIQASMSNQTNELKNMMAGFFQMNTASTSGSGHLPRNTIANPKGELKSITTRSGIVLDGPSIPIPPPFINPKEDKRVEETLTDQDLAEYTIKVPPPFVQKLKPPSQRNFIMHQRDPLHPNISYPSRMHRQKQQEKDEKLLEKLGDTGKFLILYGFSELKYKALADLGASINLMPLSILKKLGLPELISTRMTLELANRAIYTPAGIARDVFVQVGKFTFPVDFVIVDYESDPRVPLILGRPFLQTARALIDVHGEEMILRDATLSWRSLILLSLIQIFLCPNSRLLSIIRKRNSGSTITHADYSLPKYDSFLFEIEPDQGKLTSVVMKCNLAEPRVHVTNVLTTHPTLMLDSDFIPSDNSLPEYEIFYFDIKEKNIGSTTIHADISLSNLECFNFNSKPDLGELTSIVDFGIRENVLSGTNVNLPPKEDHSPLFAYVLWIFLFFLTYPVVPPNLLSFGNKDTIFDLGISNYYFPSLLPDVSHWCEAFMKFNVYLKLLNESPMDILSSTCSPMEQ
nr:hypothetical protein [Tanacetum cinerariifolium]